ncbi:MAG: acetylxylan esterase [Candidatus Latescibacterota bacterium]|jgi:dienelactone hydrolase
MTMARPDGEMMKRYLLDQVEQAAQQWEADFATRTTPERIASYRGRVRQGLLKAIGGLPEPGPLNPRVTGRIEREGYRVEKVIFESQPGCHVTALLFLPAPGRCRSPIPGVVVPVGHTGNGKAWDEYQTLGALLALNGMAGLIFDAIDESERLQYREERGAYDFDRWGHYLHGTYGHQMIGIGSILLGRNTARWEIGDALQGIDYLQSRPEVDPERIGCTGHSGGGIITAYATALDDRIKAAAPSCFLCSLPTVLATTGPGDAEQVTWAALTVGPQATDLLCQAPTPVLLCAATQDQYFDVQGARRSFRYARDVYSRLGCPERIALLVTDGPHSCDRVQRETIARWMSRWLRECDDPVSEPEICLLSEAEAQCTPDGQVMRLPGARSVYDDNEGFEGELARRRAARWVEGDQAALRERVRRIAGIRRLAELPLPRVEQGGSQQRSGYRIERLDLQPEEGIVLPALLFVPERTACDRTVVYLHEDGKDAEALPGGRIEQLVLAGLRVLAVDLRGTGATRQTGQRYWGMIDADWQDVCSAYCLGRSYVGMRAEDILVAGRHAARHLGGAPVADVGLVAVGQVGVPALHAAALEPSLFSSVRLSRTLVSWASVIERRVTRCQYANTVQGALLEYDLPDLAALLGARLRVEEPVDAMGEPIAG